MAGAIPAAAPEPVTGPGRVRWWARPGGARLVGPLVSLAIAVALFSRWGINGSLSRDEGIYTYGGEQLAHGVPPYASIFDPKTPLATFLAGIGAALARLFGNGTSREELYGIRVAFFVCACLTVVAVFLLAERLWGSVLSGLVAAAVFASYNGFAEDALSGPDAKTPGILAAVLAMWLASRRRWFWAAFAGAFAFLAWQPLVIYALVPMVLAGLFAAPGRRWRGFGIAAAGAGIPVAATVVYFAATGALAQFLASAVEFPATGTVRASEGTLTRIHDVGAVVHHYYKFSGLLFFAGLVLFVLLVIAHVVRGMVQGRVRAALADPLICVVVITGLAEFGYASFDFQGYPDVYPLLVYPALGLAGTAAGLVVLVRRRPAQLVVTMAATLAAALLVGFSWVWFTNDPAHDDALAAQRVNGCALNTLAGAKDPLWSLGSPNPLLLTGRRNPDRFIYLDEGVDRWKIKHTPGGFAGWTHQILRAHPSVVVVTGWYGPVVPRMKTWLDARYYKTGYIAHSQVFITSAAHRRAVAAGLVVTLRPTVDVWSTHGKFFPATKCE